MKPGIAAPATCPAPPAQTPPPFSVKSPMPRRNDARSSPLTPRLRSALCLAFLLFLLDGCGRHNNDPSSLTFLIESNPTNLDPRFATDSQSQKIDGLLFSSLLERDDPMNFHGDLADSWTTPDPLTY